MEQALRVLLIDDNPDNRAMTRRELMRSFPEIEATDVIDAEDFARHLSAGGFHLVITDYRLRWTDGIAVVRLVKASYPLVPVIMFTSTGTQDTAVEAMKAGLDDYVIKAPRHYIRLPVAIRGVLERREMRIRSSALEQHCQNLINGLEVGLYRATLDGTLLECNAAFLRLLGYASLHEAQDADLRRLLPRERRLDVTGESWERVFLNRREIEFRRPDGLLVWVALSETVSRPDGRLVIDGLMENITDRKQAELALKQLMASLQQRVEERTLQLEAANRQLGAFVHTVSHDLQEPLRSLQALAHAMQEDCMAQLDGLARDYLGRIIAGAERMEVMIDGLLVFSQVGQVAMALQPVNLDDVVQEALLQVEAEVRQRRAQVSVERPLPQVLGHFSTLVRVLTNLISNAVKFVAVDVSPQVHVWAEPHAQAWRLLIQDNGIGIAPDDHERIFGLFERLHGAELYPGVGIGLAIVRKGIERMGGRLGLESARGRGSRFWFELAQVPQW